MGRANEFPWNSKTCDAVAMSGHLKIIKWLHANDCFWNEFACAVVAEQKLYPKMDTSL